MSNPPEAAQPLTPDQSAAHDFLTELRTRITTQPLPYQYGIEARALESLWEIFAHARAAIKKYPGCEQFAAVVTEMLNVDIRPVTSKWHKPFVDGRLDSRDGADEFRADLQAVRIRIQDVANKLHLMAYGCENKDTQTDSSAISEAELEEDFQTLAYGIPAALSLTAEFADKIHQDEAQEVEARRGHFKIKVEEGKDAIGLALSGGGIRSATFGLGVVQVLAEHNFLKQVDFLSTVSGGGYTGSFLSTHLREGVAEQALASPHGPEAIRYLRQQVKFLAAKNFKESWAMATATLGCMLLNWTAPLFCLAFFAMIAIQLKRFLPDSTLWPLLFTSFTLLSALSLILFGWAMRWQQDRIGLAGKALGSFTGITLVIGLFWALNLGHDSLQCLLQLSTTPAKLSSFFAALFAAPALIRFMPVLQNPKIRKIVLQVLL